MSFYSLSRYATTVTLTFKGGESLQIHEVLYRKLGLSAQGIDDDTCHTAPISLDICAQAGYVLVDYLYHDVPDFSTLQEASATKLPDTVDDDELCEKLAPVVEILLELSCCLERYEDLGVLVVAAQDTFDQVAKSQCPIVMLRAMRISLSRMNSPAFAAQRWIRDRIGCLIAKLAPAELNSFAISLDTQPGNGIAVSLDNQMFLGAVLNALIKNNEIMKGNRAIGPGAMQPTPDLKRQIMELSDDAKKAQKCVDRMSRKILPDGSKARVITYDEYETLENIMPKLRGYFADMEKELGIHRRVFRVLDDSDLSE